MSRKTTYVKKRAKNRYFLAVKWKMPIVPNASSQLRLTNYPYNIAVFILCRMASDGFNASVYIGVT